MPRIRFVFIRHGQKEEWVEDEKANLTQEAVGRTRSLAKLLKDLDVTPDCYFTSRYAHAWQTAEHLGEIIQTRSQAKIIEVDALTPKTEDRDFGIENIMVHAAWDNIQLIPGKTYALIGHEDRLSQLITAFTGQRYRPLDHLDAVCVGAKDLKALRRGQGELEWRLPVKAYQEDELRSKVVSKLYVATFLAGFTFAALLEMLKSGQLPRMEFVQEGHPHLTWEGSVLPLAATLCLTAAMALFIAVIYIYDRLSMPEGFWATSRTSKYGELPLTVQEYKNKHGLVYSHMIHSWLFVFTPGVILAGIGFMLFVIHYASPLLGLAYAAVIVLVVLYYRKIRPKLGVD